MVENKEYYYVNYYLKKILGPYESATTFSSGIAAVKQGEIWRIIDGSGNYVGKEGYEDIIIDEQNQSAYYIRDNNSLNHTYVDQVQIPSQVEVPLEDRSKICLANEEFEFRLH